jgi:pseudo-rSAM protein
MPDNQVYANVNMESLGTIHDTIYSLIYKELTEGKSWLRIRDQKPCADCIYQWLCPAPSNYEIVLGKYNLCNIKGIML